MKKSNYWVSSGLYSTLHRLSAVLFGFGSFAILVRYLTKDDFGIYALFISVTSLIEVARIGLIQNALIKFLSSATEEEYPEIITASFALNVLMTIVSIILLIVSAPLLGDLWGSPKIVPLFYYYIITTVILIPFHHMNFIQQANFDFRGYFFSSVIRNGSFFFCIVIEIFVFGSTPELTSLVIYLSVSAFTGTLTTFLLGKKYLRLTGRLNFDLLKKLFHFGKFVLGTNLSSMIFTSIDQFMLGSLLPASSVAVFNTANRVSNIIDIPIASAAAIVFPQSAKRSAEGGASASAYLYEKSVGVLLALLIPMLLFVFVFAEWIIIIIAGSAYLEAANILRVIAVISLFQPIIRQFGTMMDSIGRPRINFYLILIVSGLNILLNYSMISIWGTIGAAYATLTTIIVFSVIALIILKKTIQITISHIFGYIPSSYGDIFGRIKQFLSDKKPK